jgi:hypothetical protein
VQTAIDDTFRAVADVEADRAQRADDRADRLAEAAGRRTAAGEASYESGRERLARIPFGQPRMPDHHSYGRDTRYRERAAGAMDKGVAPMREGGQLAARADAATAHQAHRVNPRVTQRRIERLQADARGVERELANARRVGAAQSYVDRLTSRLEQLNAEITYWQGQAAAAVEANEYRPWGPEHFQKGDEVRIGGTWYPVARVNKKSLSIPPVIGMGSPTSATGQPWSWTDTVPYDKVFGRRRGGVVDEQPPKAV